MTYSQSKGTSQSSGKSKPASSGCGCNGSEPPVHHETCCRLTCFERPNYFCGQLLSDADLTLQQTYFREKNKLYHRTIDGFGVVCGLRLRCDCDCKGRITISDGYAIDCCGNDLVVCEPNTFDVIGELRKKNWLIERPKDDCPKPAQKTNDASREGESREHEREEEGCIIRQCFYIGVCYSEEQADFTTPYTTDCTPAPGACQAARVREGVRFEVYDKLPQRPNPLTEVEKRIERCFRIFREGQFSKGLIALGPRILEILDCGSTVLKPPQDQPLNEPAGVGANPPAVGAAASGGRDVFNELKALFQHQLRVCPDQYNCNLSHEVHELCYPSDNTTGPTGVAEAFTKLFELIEKYVFSCVLAELAFLCPEPPKECCVLLGCVEVENGRLTRVINYPRWYLWCFANLFEVLIYTLANDAACARKSSTVQTPVGAETHPKSESQGCCPGFEVNVCDFLNLFLFENRAAEYAARTSARAFQTVYRSLVSAFDFVSPGGVSPAVFRNRGLQESQALARALNFDLDTIGAPSGEASDTLSSLLGTFMHFGRDPMAAFSEIRGSEDVVRAATRILDAPARSVGGATYDEVAKLTATIRKLQATVDSLQSDVYGMKSTQGSTPAPATPAEKPPEGTPEGGSGGVH